MKKITYLFLLLGFTVLINTNEGFAQKKDNPSAKTKPVKVNKQGAATESESVKTMYEAIKNLFSKNKKQAGSKTKAKDANSPKAKKTNAKDSNKKIVKKKNETHFFQQNKETKKIC